MGDDYLDDAEFYDGPDENDGRPGQAYLPLHLPAWLTGEPPAECVAPVSPPAVPSWLHVPTDAPPPPARLLTAAEFMAKHGLKGPQ